MAFLFGRTKSNASLAIIQSTKSHLEETLNAQLVSQQLSKEDPLSKELAAIKVMIQGNPYDEEPKPEKVTELVNNMITADFLYLLARSIRFLTFTGRKDAQAILSYTFRHRPENSTSEDTPALAYAINSRPEVIVELCRGYEFKESATACGTVLREILKHDTVAAIVLYDHSAEGEPAVRGSDIDLNEPQTGDGIFWNFFRWIDKGVFEVSADAFTTFRDILTKHKQLTSRYLTLNFDLFFERYHRMLVNSDSYVTKRQSIKLLGEILLDRVNYNVMTAYVDQGDHLKISMNLLRDDRKMVQYEGFHVFKVFVANPNKSRAVTRILQKNREKLLSFLATFLEDRTEDDQFLDEKAFLIRTIDTLPAISPVNGHTAAAAPAPA